MSTSVLSTTKVFNPVSISLFEMPHNILDPRKKRGIRHNFHAILKLVILGFCSRLVCLEHIVEFAGECWDQIKDPLGFSRDTPPGSVTFIL